MLLIRPVPCLCSTLAALLLLRPAALFAQAPAPRDAAIREYSVNHAHEPPLSPAARVRLLRAKVKYVFVLYQENRSFDSYFATFPGAEGIYSHPVSQTPGFNQTLLNTDGSTTTVHPFRIGPEYYAADTDDIDHSHNRILAKMDIVNGRSRMDRFAINEELKYSPQGKPILLAKQFGELAMAHEDCDTVPILWRYADRFVLFDHIFQEMTGPSTPGNLAIIGAQSGQTQWALHPDEGYKDNGTAAAGVPLLNDNDPFWGSQNDPTPAAGKAPVNPRDIRNGKEYGTEINLTYATLPLSMLGNSADRVTKSDRDPEGDLRDVGGDVAFLSRLRQNAVPFGWFEEGYDREPTDPTSDPVDANGLHASYITHHNGPQYFGYVSNNPNMRSQLHGLDDFFAAIRNRALPANGGVFFVKGGSQNIFGFSPASPEPAVQKNFRGDDDHPGYADAQISEAMLAKAINAIASSPYWSQSAIIITWDDSEGDYDHLPPPIRAKGPDGSVISDGPRVPLILLSPFARTHYVAHAQGNHASVVKFVDTLFHLPPLATLPDELRGRQAGLRKFGQKDIGPQDALTPGITDLLDAFSAARLLGKAPPLPPSYASVPDTLVDFLPQTTGFGCRALGIVPVDRQLGIPNTIPADFNPRPRTNPGVHAPAVPAVP